MTKEIDEILKLQILLARLGESPRYKWWNVDASDKMGGFFALEQMFVTKNEKDNKTILFQKLIVGEAILLAASWIEKERIQTKRIYGFFTVHHDWNRKLIERWEHFKQYPEETPTEILSVLDPELEKEEILKQIQIEIADIKPEYEETSIGLKLKNGESEIQKLKLLGALIYQQAKPNTYPFSYYEINEN